jgi:hypothetical protein
MQHFQGHRPKRGLPSSWQPRDYGPGFGAQINPSYKQNEGTIEINSFNTIDGGQVSAPSISAAAGAVTKEEAQRDPQQLTALFTKALEHSNAAGMRAGGFKLDGKAAVVDSSRTRARSNPESGRDIATVIKSDNEVATLSFEPEWKDGTITFRPTGVVEYVASQETDPNKIIGLIHESAGMFMDT